MANKPANAAQKRFTKSIVELVNMASLGILYGANYDNDFNFQIHHVLGRSAKHNKIHIGHWFEIPVPFDLHDVNVNHPLNVTHHKHAFTDKFGKQAQIFNDMLRHMDWNEIDYNIPDDVIAAIGDTRA